LKELKRKEFLDKQKEDSDRLFEVQRKRQLEVRLLHSLTVPHDDRSCPSSHRRKKKGGPLLRETVSGLPKARSLAGVSSPNPRQTLVHGLLRKEKVSFGLKKKPF
jgi:hypothetical protein